MGVIATLLESILGRVSAATLLCTVRGVPACCTLLHTRPRESMRKRSGLLCCRSDQTRDGLRGACPSYRTTTGSSSRRYFTRKARVTAATDILEAGLILVLVGFIFLFASLVRGGFGTQAHVPLVAAGVDTYCSLRNLAPSIAASSGEPRRDRSSPSRDDRLSSQEVSTRHLVLVSAARRPPLPFLKDAGCRMSTESTAIEAMAPGAATTNDAGEDLACYRLRCNEKMPDRFVRPRRKDVTHTLFVLANCLGSSIGPDETAAFGIHIFELLQLPPLEFKLILTGKDGAGKQEFISHWAAKSENVEGVSLRPRTIVHPCLSGITVNVQPVAFQTNRGPIVFNCWDDGVVVSKLDRFDARHDFGGQCAIVMFGLDSSFSQGRYINACNLFLDIKEVFPDIPILFVGNDVEGRSNHQLGRDVATFAETEGADYVEISTHSSCNLDAPFLTLARKLVGDMNLRFVKSTAAASALSPYVYRTPTRKTTVYT